MTITLRPDQAKLQGENFDAWNSGARNVMDVLSTGGGKSIIVSDTVRIFDDAKEPTLITAHRQELVGQMSLHIARQGVRHAIWAPDSVVKSIMADHRREFQGNCYINPDARCHVGGVDTIKSRATELEPLLKQKRLNVIDEGHHVQLANKWGFVCGLVPNAFGLFVTATPSRADGKGLGRSTDGLADVMNVGLGMRDLITINALCDYEIVCPETDYDLSHLVIGESGDYTQASQKREAERSQIVGDVVEQYCIHAYQKKTVVFTTDVGTANKIAEKFNAFGIPAAAISANTPDAVRSEAIRRLRSGQLWVLVNVDLLGEGFDLPAIECVIMARPTASLAVFMQQFGRALRTMIGKAFGLVIDMVSNIIKHKFPDMPRVWSLGRREGRGQAREKDPELVDVIVCKKCTKPYAIVRLCCPNCGAAPEARAALPGVRGALEQVQGDLTRLTVEQLAELRRSMMPVSVDRKLEQAIHASNGMANKQRIIDSQTALLEARGRLEWSIAEWAGYQRWKGRDDGEIHRRFYVSTGVDVLSALGQDRQALEDLNNRVTDWIGK